MSSTKLRRAVAAMIRAHIVSKYGTGIIGGPSPVAAALGALGARPALAWHAAASRRGPWRGISSAPWPRAPRTLLSSQTSPIQQEQASPNAVLPEPAAAPAAPGAAAAVQQAQKQATFAGTVQRVQYRSAGTAYSVLRVQVAHEEALAAGYPQLLPYGAAGTAGAAGAVGAAARTPKRHTICVVGTLPEASPVRREAPPPACVPPPPRRP